MRVGCGQTVKTIRGHRYIYCWHYERRGGRSVQIFTYVGREDDPEVRRKASEMNYDYCAMKRDELDRIISSCLDRC